MTPSGKEFIHELTHNVYGDHDNNFLHIDETVTSRIVGPPWREREDAQMVFQGSRLSTAHTGLRRKGRGDDEGKTHVLDEGHEITEYFALCQQSLMAGTSLFG